MNKLEQILEKPVEDMGQEDYLYITTEYGNNKYFPFVVNAENFIRSLGNKRLTRGFEMIDEICPLLDSGNYDHYLWYFNRAAQLGKVLSQTNTVLGEAISTNNLNLEYNEDLIKTEKKWRLFSGIGTATSLVASLIPVNYLLFADESQYVGHSVVGGLAICGFGLFCGLNFYAKIKDIKDTKTNIQNLDQQISDLEDKLRIGEEFVSNADLFGRIYSKLRDYTIHNDTKTKPRIVRVEDYYSPHLAFERFDGIKIHD